MAVVAVPFILYLVRFCSPKPCKIKVRQFNWQGYEFTHRTVLYAHMARSILSAWDYCRKPEGR